MRRLPCRAVLLASIAFACSGLTARAGDAMLPEALRRQAVDCLREAMAGRSLWVKVHAAENLLALDYPQGVREACLAEEKIRGQEPQSRIGIWRVLAGSGNDPADRAAWLGKIRQAFLDANGPDRLHAVEAVAKLGYKALPAERPAFERYIADGNAREAAFARWALAAGGRQDDRNALVACLDGNGPGARRIAAIAIARLADLDPQTKQKLLAAAQSEPASSEARVALVATAYAVSPASAQADALRNELAVALSGDFPEYRKIAAAAFAQRGNMNDLSLLVPLLGDADADVRVAAAHAILRIERRVPRSIRLLDWGVIALYMVAMVAIGWYYSRRTASPDDYLLGGRRMRPIIVGLSLFTALLSTLTYMSYPGEMIKHGPMVMAGYLAYPLIFLVVGYVLIPFIMKVPATSAYEILETRLGLPARMAGSVIFLFIRLIWMAAILYVTSAVILVPVLGLDRRLVPWISMAIAAVTLVYSTMGGLRAVVVTDTVQTFIKLGGAVASIVLITIYFRGFSWFPTQWAPNWDRPVFWFNPDVRVTMAGAMLYMFGFLVCTSGSDQMVIQRYLATRDAKAARRVLATTLITGTCVVGCLVVLGFALLAYFRANPQLIPDGRTIQTGADQLFSRYIVYGLPVGVCGLVVSALLAAAMGSISSGVTSTCSVILIDFFGRLSRGQPTSAQRVRMARLISVGVGAVVLLISLGVDRVEGNLLEVVKKIGSGLVDALFLLFFVAMFVPWGRTFATLVGCVASIIVGSAIAYFGAFGLSFIWIEPCALGAGIVVASTLSLIPIGPTVRQRTARQ